MADPIIKTPKIIEAPAVVVNEVIPPARIDPAVSLPPKTTREEDINTASQRRINLIWEHTQAAVAIMVCTFTMVAGMLTLIATLFFDKPERQIPTIFAAAFGTVIGFYLGRTNHAAIGGVGKKPDKPEYEGR